MLSVRRGLVLLVLLTLVGCLSNPPPAPLGPSDVLPSPTVTVPADRSAEFPAHIHVEGHGAAEFVWDGVEKLTVNRVGYPGAEISWLSVGMGLTVPLPTEPRYRFRWSFDIFNQYMDKPGIFQIAPRTGKGATTLGDMATLVWMRVSSDVQDQYQVYDEDKVDFVKTFSEIAMPCMVTVGKTFANGSIVCPELLSADGERASYKATWEGNSTAKTDE